MSKMTRYSLRLMAIGILIMNTGVLVNYLWGAPDDLVDFFKGLGISLVLASLWPIAKSHRCNRSKEVRT